jgi:hypothetical protein
MSTQVDPPQVEVLSGQAQPLFWQVLPPRQGLPHPPQLALSFVKSRHRPLLPGVQQCALAHCTSAWQAVVLLAAILLVQLVPTQTWPEDEQLVLAGPQAPAPSQALANREE